MLAILSLHFARRNVCVHRHLKHRLCVGEDIEGDSLLSRLPESRAGGVFEPDGTYHTAFPAAKCVCDLVGMKLSIFALAHDETNIRARSQVEMKVEGCGVFRSVGDVVCLEQKWVHNRRRSRGSVKIDDGVRKRCGDWTDRKKPKPSLTATTIPCSVLSSTSPSDNVGMFASARSAISSCAPFDTGTVSVISVRVVAEMRKVAQKR